MNITRTFILIINRSLEFTDTAFWLCNAVIICMIKIRVGHSNIYNKMFLYRLARFQSVSLLSALYRLTIY